MCYSAQIAADYKEYVRMFGATMDIREFIDVFWHRRQDSKLKLPKAMEDSFASPQTESERRIKAEIDAFRAAEQQRIERELNDQRTRLAEAQQKLAVKATKAAAESARIAADKISRAKIWLDDLQRTEPKARDSRIYPGVYAPVMVMEAGKLVVKPMRYQCRPPGKPAFYDRKFPGTYNARRDNLEGFWRDLFGTSHGLVMASAFYEHVKRDGEDVVLEFKPRDGGLMLVACLWSRWTAHGEPDLLSFAAITDEPPAEVAAAGHDRCFIPIRRENIGAWLDPTPRLKDMHGILDDRERPYYEHRLAA